MRVSLSDREFLNVLFEDCLDLSGNGLVVGARVRPRVRLCGGAVISGTVGALEPLCGPGQERGPDDGGNGDDEGEGEGRTGIVTKTRPKTKKPSLYKVLLLNDDYTPMEFVVLVLERYFGKSMDEATEIMLHVHHKGVGICGVYTYEIAETKVTQVTDFSRKNQHPLQCTMEKE